MQHPLLRVLSLLPCCTEAVLQEWCAEAMCFFVLRQSAAQCRCVLAISFIYNMALHKHVHISKVGKFTENAFHGPLYAMHGK